MSLCGAAFHFLHCYIIDRVSRRVTGVSYSVIHCSIVYFTISLWITAFHSVLKCITRFISVFDRVLQCLCSGSVWLLTWSCPCPAGSVPGCRHWGTLCSGTVPPGGGSNTDNTTLGSRGPGHMTSQQKQQLDKNKKANCIKPTSLWGKIGGVRSPQPFHAFIWCHLVDKT